MNNNQNELSKRNREIYEKRERGLRIVDLSKEYSISIPRVHRICMQEENKDLREKVITLENSVSSCQNVLKHKK
jgi:Mor family transcriptional regulator